MNIYLTLLLLKPKCFMWLNCTKWFWWPEGHQLDKNKGAAHNLYYPDVSQTTLRHAAHGPKEQQTRSGITWCLLGTGKSHKNPLICLYHGVFKQVAKWEAAAAGLTSWYLNVRTVWNYKWYFISLKVLLPVFWDATLAAKGLTTWAES